MLANKTAKKKPGISDDAVKAKTSKTWAQWFTLLDQAGGRRMTHKEIVAVLNQKYGVGPWWQQMVTVEYERARHLREKHQTATGYSISRSKTMNAGARKIFTAWQEAKTRVSWLPKKKLTMRKTTANKSLRMLWHDGKTEVNVSFLAKGPDKTQVVIEHNKLANAAAAKRMQAYWSKALEKLQARVGG